MGRIFATIGLCLITLGTLLIMATLVRDWRAHSDKPLVPMVAKGQQWLARHLLRRKPQVHTVEAHDTLHLQVTTTASGYAVPPSNAPVDVQMRFVRERITDLERKIAEQRQDLSQKIDRVQSEAQAADAESHAALAKVTETIRDLATRNVRMELFGVLLVGLGSIATTLPAVFGWR